MRRFHCNTKRPDPHKRDLLERRVLATIIERPEEYLLLRPRYCPCCVFEDGRNGFLANLVADAVAIGRRAGVAELAHELWRGGPITEAGAALYLSEIVLLPPVADLRDSLAELRGPRRRPADRHPTPTGAEN
jgi:hypothetical protein